jgi:hypothetical protein
MVKKRKRSCKKPRVCTRGFLVDIISCNQSYCFRLLFNCPFSIESRILSYDIILKVKRLACTVGICIASTREVRLCLKLFQKYLYNPCYIYIELKCYKYITSSTSPTWLYTKPKNYYNYFRILI